MKGRWIFLVGGFLCGWVWIYAAIRLAEPDSWWARRFYDEEKMEKSKRRYLNAEDLELEKLPPPSSPAATENS